MQRFLHSFVGDAIFAGGGTKKEREDEHYENDVIVITNRFPKELNFFCNPRHELMRDHLCYGHVDAYALACAEDTPPMHLVPFCLAFKFLFDCELISEWDSEDELAGKAPKASEEAEKEVVGEPMKTLRPTPEDASLSAKVMQEELELEQLLKEKEKMSTKNELVAPPKIALPALTGAAVKTNEAISPAIPEPASAIITKPDLVGSPNIAGPGKGATVVADRTSISKIADPAPIASLKTDQTGPEAIAKPSLGATVLSNKPAPSANMQSAPDSMKTNLNSSSKIAEPASAGAILATNASSPVNINSALGGAPAATNRSRITTTEQKDMTLTPSNFHPFSAVRLPTVKP
ncbi:unnamed protein product [Cylicocyclus nassatus]|uniref:Uncharacterized protein n=1 Tax=Cylicocyclus nassatus TaxID=53992 RepID=A0AA36GU81_CYLNA|nr:unnamed protein product [Cylicocyclus nassatus]